MNQDIIVMLIMLALLAYGWGIGYACGRQYAKRHAEKLQAIKDHRNNLR